MSIPTPTHLLLRYILYLRARSWELEQEGHLMAHNNQDKEKVSTKSPNVMEITPAVPDQKPIIASYIAGIKDIEHGESLSKILSYFVPELITALVLYSLLYFYD